MPYNTSKLTSVEQCDAALALAANKQSDLQYDLTVITKQSTNADSRNAKYSGTLVSVKAQIDGLTAGLASITDAATVKKMNSQIRKLNDRKENLEESIDKGTGASVMEQEFEVGLIQAALTEVASFKTAVEARKAAL